MIPVMNLNALYIDPAATSMLLTSIIGVMVAIGATIIVVCRNAKKKKTKKKKSLYINIVIK